MRTLIPILFIVLAVGCKAKDSSTLSQTDTATASSTATTATTGTEAPISSTETAVAPEVNPPGDIPDTQAFVKYSNTAGGYQLEVPEGWARTEAGADATFVNKFDGVSIAVTPATVAPTAVSARANQAKQIQSQGKAVTMNSVSEANLPGGKAVVIKYTSNSDPNPVTNKRVRLENLAYIFYKGGKEATLTVWAPQGADNADQWNRMSKSFRWL